MIVASSTRPWRLPPDTFSDRMISRVEAHAPVILGAVAEKPDITLVELQTLLAEHTVAVAVSTLWRFFARRKITLKYAG